jgi:hypothetical protein
VPCIATVYAAEKRNDVHLHDPTGEGEQGRS